jgi:sugar phosphate permease
VLLLLSSTFGFTAFFWKNGLDTYILESVDRSQRGSAAGFMNNASQLGSLVAPAEVGHSFDLAGSHSHHLLLVLASGLLASAVVIFVALLKKRA